MKRTAIATLFALFAVSGHAATGDSLPDAFQFRPEAPRFQAGAPGAIFGHLHTNDPYQVRPDYPASVRNSGGNAVEATYEEARWRSEPADLDRFPEQVIGAH